MFLLREKKIIKLLLENEKKFTTVQIAAELKVNQRTIKTDIRRINFELEKHSCYIQTKRGVGVWLESNSDGKRFLKELLYENDDDYISVEIRKYYIASDLLNYKNYISMEQLANQYYVSKATVLNDINELDSFWEASRINITKKVKYGVRAEGEEKQIRRALFEAQKRIVEYFSGNALGKLQILYPNIDLQILEGAIRQTEKTFSFVLTDISFIEFFIYIGIMVQRVKMGCEIEKNQDSAGYAGESREWFVCNFLCEQMKEHMQCSIPDFEMQGMMKRLKGLRFQVPMAKIREKNDLRSHNPVLFDFMLDILREVDGKYLLNLEEDEDFICSLFHHLETMIQRVQGKMYLENPILETVKNEMSYEYEIASYIVRKFNLIYEMEATDNEIGYITFHIAASVERAAQRERKRYIVTIVCMTGMGTSQFISIKLSRLFPDLIIKQIVSESMAKNLKQEEQDLVISTVPLTLDDIDVIQVSVVLNNRDVERIQKYVEKKETVLETEDEIYTCLKEFLHEEISIFNCDLRTREEAIYLLGNRMIYEGYADEEYVSSVFEREKISDTYMSSFIAIPHSFVGHTKKEGIGIMTLKKPIPWGNGQVRIVFMLALDSGAENKIFQKIFGAIYNLTRTQKDVDKILKADSLKKLKNSLTESSKFPTSNA